MELTQHEQLIMQEIINNLPINVPIDFLTLYLTYKQSYEKSTHISDTRFATLVYLSLGESRRLGFYYRNIIGGKWNNKAVKTSRSFQKLVDEVTRYGAHFYFIINNKVIRNKIKE